jgi:septal ring factor EnvC (AmiA/AmiB activator)
MTGQLDLLPRSGVEIKPEPGRTEPRFWVRRLVIWEKPGTLLREIELRPGLNIIWSPDPADRGTTQESESVLGHGSGKTLFCRLLRYVLGEDSFSPDDQRFRIGLAFPEGMVGAEVMIDGTQWAVLRPIGSHRLHYAVPDAGLEQVLAGDYAATGMEPFLKAVESQILSADVVALIPVEHPLQAWQVALAWLSRDQECRFDKVLDWRSSDSDSGSPARGLSTTKLLDALRALIGAIVPEEYKLRAEISALESSQREAEQEAVRQAGDANRVRARLIAELGLNPNELLPGHLAVEPLRQAAKAKLARLATVSPDVDVSDLEALRSQADEAREQAEYLKRTLAEVEARIPEIEGLMRRIRGERPGISAEIDQHETPLCPVCDVPISRALAEGCKLSHKLPDLDAAKKRLEQNNQELGMEDARLKANQAQKVQITQALKPAQSYAEALRQQMREIERSRDARSDAWGKTKQ